MTTPSVGLRAFSLFSGLVAASLAACSGGGDTTSSATSGSGGASSSGSSGQGGGSGGVTSTSTGTGTGGAPNAASGTIVPLYSDPSDPAWKAMVAAKQAHPSV
ncbi:MAG: hypothetical protein ABJE95_25240, partial [Byssovorax sp.]